MEFILHPWHILILALSASINRERDRAIGSRVTYEHWWQITPTLDLKPVIV